MELSVKNALATSEEIRKKLCLFRNEIALINGENIAVSPLPSVHFFTATKCASEYIYMHIMVPLAKVIGLTPVRIASLEDMVGINNEYSNVQSEYKSLSMFENMNRSVSFPWARNGYFFGPYREYFDSEVWEHDKIILLLRDVRDVMTSHYFSMKYSHHVPQVQNKARERILHLREKAHTQSIDEYVLNLIPKYKYIYGNYATNFLGKPNVCFVTYEELVSNAKSWLVKIVSHLELPLLDSDIDTIINATDFSIPEENAHAHKRQVLPGDHIRKLKPETIATINEEFGHILRLFNYPVPA